MKLRSVILSLFVVVAFLFAPLADAAGWEEIARQPVGTERIDAEDVDIATRDGYLYISVGHTVSVKLFTILGQSISQTTLSPGNYRYRLSARGIYILKVGSVTRRVTI